MLLEINELTVLIKAEAVQLSLSALIAAENWWWFGLRKHFTNYSTFQEINGTVFNLLKVILTIMSSRISSLLQIPKGGIQTISNYQHTWACTTLQIDVFLQL